MPRNAKYKFPDSASNAEIHIIQPTQEEISKLLGSKQINGRWVSADHKGFIIADHIQKNGKDVNFKEPSLVAELKALPGIDDNRYTGNAGHFMLYVAKDQDAFDAARGVLEFMEQRGYMTHDERIGAHKELGLAMDSKFAVATTSSPTQEGQISL